MKYVILKSSVTGFLHPIVFDVEVVHATMARARAMNELARLHPVSAGFVYKTADGWKVEARKSESLNLGPADGDEALLNLFLVEGLSGLDLSNYLAYLRIQAGKL